MFLCRWMSTGVLINILSVSLTFQDSRHYFVVTILKQDNQTTMKEKEIIRKRHPLQNQLKELKKKLREGDQKRISELTEYDYGYVRNCLSEDRNNRLIVKAAQLIIEEREKSDRTLKAKLKRAA